ncbi:ribosome-binding factor A [Mycoplasma suis]|uniref:Ribosome-binding factor A n=2 Tax=Mycoplasma suis TaxID=57372 RepID=F0QQX8_MYCSL|nr:ribosome-binding factor A [Mycoplasma suis]ADX97898.1 ribosome-binding factor A [Mycoplasma suis str. Illinois]CBZ40399.1 Ribosome-binding factor A [Mycoplasma suis KI3806]
MKAKQEKLSKEIYIVMKRIWLTELDEKLYTFIGINHVKLAPNLSTIVIYVDLELLKDKHSSKEILDKLRKLTPFLKHRLIEKLSLPTYFKLVFEEDHFIKQARKVETLINQEFN